jgi:heat shock 70kDa protein 4
MEFVGIDIGNYKTVIASSRENGRIMEDEQSKRTIGTVLELSTPVRRFGNGVTSDTESLMDVRFRGFRDQMDCRRDCEVLAMFLKYLGRVVEKNTPTDPSIYLAVPSYFKERERRILMDLARSVDLKLTGIVTDVSAMGMFACVRRENMPGKFMIFDFGHSKSTAALFTFEGNAFKPEYIREVRLGAINFDQKLIDIVASKCSLRRTKVIEERIIRTLDKIKSALNSTEHCSLHLILTDSPVNLAFSREEYRGAVVEDLEELERFVDRVIEETKFDGMVEVMGGNSSSFLIKEMLKGKINYKATLDLSDSCAIGAALGNACSSLRTRFTLHDMVGREVAVKMGGESVRPTVIYKATDVTAGDAKVVTYKRKGKFELEFFEDGEQIATLVVNKVESEEPEPVQISVAVNKCGVVDVLGVDCKGPVEHIYKKPGLSDEDKEGIRETEKRYRDAELELEIIGCMRNRLETMVVGLSDALLSKFPGVFNEEEMSRISELTADIFDIPPCSAIKEEEDARESIITSLKFVSDKLSEHQENLVRDLVGCRTMIEDLKSENPKVFTPAFYKLQGLMYKIDGYVKDLSLNLFSLSEFDPSHADSLKNDVTLYIARANEEVAQKKKADEERAEAERRRAESDKESREKKRKEDAQEAREAANQEARETKEINSDHESSDVASIDE